MFIFFLFIFERINATMTTFISCSCLGFAVAESGQATSTI